MNVIVWLEFKLAYFEATLQRFSNYATVALPQKWNYLCQKY